MPPLEEVHFRNPAAGAIAPANSIFWRAECNGYHRAPVFCLLLTGGGWCRGPRSPAWRVGAHRRLVDIGAPARAARQAEGAVLDDRRNRHQIVLPRHVVDVDLHDAEIRHRGAEMRAHQGREMAVEIMRRDIDLVSV